MTSPRPSGTDPPVRLGSARAAVSVLFLVNAVLYATLVPRLPEVKAALDLDNTAFGAALAAVPVGALLNGLSAPALIGRFGSGRLATWGLVVLGAAVAMVSVAGGWVALAVVLLVVGGVDSVVDVAQNAHGFRVQRLYGRSIVNAFHGLWSVGAVLGGLLGSAAAGLAVPLGWHLGAVAITFGALALGAGRHLLPGPEDTERHPPPVLAEPGVAVEVAGPPRPRPGAGAGWQAGRLLVVLGLLAVCGAVVEDAGASWAALYLRTELGAGAAVGGLGFVALQTAMTVGRLSGDRVVDRFGQRRVSQAGGAMIAAGMAVALGLPSVATTLVGFAAAGLGVATLVPAVMHTADEVPGLPHGAGLTWVSWLLRVGFLLSPPAVGLVADVASLRVALTPVVAAGLLVLLLGRSLAPGSQTAPARPSGGTPRG